MLQAEAVGMPAAKKWGWRSAVLIWCLPLNSAPAGAMHRGPSLFMWPATLGE